MGMDEAEKKLLFDTSQKVTALYTLLLENGFVEQVKENPIEVQRERLQVILEEAVKSEKVSIEDAKTTTDNSMKYTTLEVLTKFVDKVESSINDVIEGEVE